MPLTPERLNQIQRLIVAGDAAARVQALFELKSGDNDREELCETLNSRHAADADASRRALYSTALAMLEQTPAASGRLAGLADAQKQMVSDALAGLLASPIDPRAGIWVVSALGELNQPSALTALASSLHGAAANPIEAVRCQAARMLFRIGPINLDALLQPAETDVSPDVRAIVRRARVTTGHVPVQALIDSIDPINSRTWTERLAACKVLSESDLPPLSETIEDALSKTLCARLIDADEHCEVRVAAADALGSVRYRCAEAIAAVDRTLRTDAPDEVKRHCVAALARIRKPEIQSALLMALQCDDPTREAAALAIDALTATVGKAATVSLLVEELISNDVIGEAFLRALRQLDSSGGAQLLMLKAVHGDPQIQARAMRVLLKLGPDDTYQSVLRHQVKISGVPSKTLSDADQSVLTNMTTVGKLSQDLLNANLRLHGVCSLVVVAGLVVGITAALYCEDEFRRYAGIGIVSASLIGAALLFFRSPIRTNAPALATWIKAELLLSSHLHQLQQTDDLHRHALLFTPLATDQVKEIGNQIRSSFKETLNQAEGYFERP